MCIYIDSSNNNGICSDYFSVDIDGSVMAKVSGFTKYCMHHLILTFL